MIIDQNRLKKQVEFGDLFVNTIKNGGIGGALCAATGFGKSYTAILLILRFNKDKKVNIVVPSIPLKKQWEDDLFVNQIYNARVFVVNTYIKEEHICDFLIGDEAHKFTTYSAECFNKMLTITKFSYVLLMSATFNEEQRTFINSHNIPILMEIKLSEAVNKKWISEYIEYNLALDLDEEERELYDKLSNTIKGHFGYFGSDLDTALKCMNDKEFRKEYCMENELDEKDIGKRATLLQGAISSRKALIYGGKRKISIIKEITDKSLLKTIVFSETIKYCKEVQKTLKGISTIYHSGLKEAEKEKALVDIRDNTNTIRAILTARALDEGVDVYDIFCGVIASGTSVERQQIQRKGRVLRFMEGKLALIINLYFKDTVEESWLKKRQKGQLPAKWIESLDEIDYEQF